MKKTNTKKRTRNHELMLTLRVSKQLLNSLNKVSSKISLSRSDYIRTILQRDVDSHPLS
jgi:metal-responsive CopG/Arc/MetJ family transcriptional regulator